MARSLQEIIRQRQRAGFVGRASHLAFFRDNLDTPLDDERRRFLFSIHGDGGIGKSFLVSRLRQIADECGRICAVVDDSVYDIPEAMAAIAEQFEQQDAKLKRFAQRYDAYRKHRQELESGIGSADRDGAASKVTQAVVRMGYGAVRGTPIGGAIAGVVDPALTAEAVDQIRSAATDKIRRRDDVRLLSPVEELTPIFVEGLRQLTEPVALFFDTYERTSPFLDDWIRALFDGAYGELPPDLTVTVSGRDPLDASRWSAYLSVLEDVPLTPFTTGEARQLLSQKGVTDEQVVEVILRVSDNLPLAVAMLAESRPSASSAVDDITGSVVERFLQWEDDPARREIALVAALPRWIDQDVLAILAGDAEPARVTELFGWLARQSFVTQSGGRCHYHDIVREPMLRLNRHLSPRRWRELHAKLAAAFQRWRESDSREGGWSDPRRQELELGESYHHLCADSAQALPIALGKAVSACRESTGLARRWAEMLISAGHDGDVTAVADLGDRLAQALGKESGGTVAYLDELLRHPRFPTAERSDAFRERGRQYRNADRYDEALADFNQSLDLNQEYTDALAGRGETYRLMGRYEEALRDFDRAIELDPDDDWAIVSRAETYLLMDRYEEALRDFNRAIELDPDNDWTIAYLAETYLLMGRHEEALRDFDRAIELDPDYAWAIAQRGRTYRSMERYEEALRDFDRGIRLDPVHWVIGDRGETYRLMGRYQEALNDFDRAIELDPDDAWVIASRAETYRSMGRYEEAIADFDRAIELDPDYCWAIVRRGEIYRSTELYEKAIEDFDRAIELDPEDAWVIALRGSTYRLLKRFDEALIDLNRAIELDKVWAVDERARLHRAMGHYAESVADFDRSIRFDPLDDHVIAERVVTSGIEHHGTEAFQCVVDLEVNPLEAVSLARSLVTWLTSSGVIEPQLSDCVPGDARGYAPGPSRERAVSEPGRWAGRFHGVRVEEGRWVGPSGAMRVATCPACGSHVQAREQDRPTAAWESLNDAILLWQDGGRGVWNCPGCQEPNHINDWEIDPPWAVGNLVALFWNWPPLREEFTADIGRILGHRCAVISGTI